MKSGFVIAAVRNEMFDEAINTDVKTVFLLNPNIALLAKQAKKAKEVNKRIFIHIDLAEGIGKDEFGLKFVKDLGIDGIITTRSNMVKLAKNLGMQTVQRFFIVDSHSVETTVEAVKNSKPSMMEIMPGVITKIVPRLSKETDIPVILGGIIETKEEIKQAEACGAANVSVGKKQLWI